MNLLSVRTSHSQPLIISFSALCVTGWVTSNQIKSAFRYVFEKTKEGHLISIEKTSKKKFSDIIDELLSLLLGLSLLEDTKIECSGEWSNEEQIQHAVSWANAQECSCNPLSMDQPLHQLTKLSLQDLADIHELFETLEGSSRMDCTSKEFASIFPFSNLYDSTHGSLRHSKGNETYIEFVENQAPITYKVDSPRPCEFHFDEWCCAFEGKPAPKLRKNTQKQKGYFKSEYDRWQTSKLLGDVPEEHKAQVFAWVENSINTVNYFHDTHGADGPLPDKFEIKIGDKTMTATPDLIFGLSEK